MSLLGAVTPSDAPQAGVKRNLQGKPTNVPNNLPAFRGRDVAPGGNVKVPKLNQGNKPNQQTNVAIPYNRVCPLEFLSGWTGRLAPGDVAFILKYPPGFLASLPNANNATAGTATMSRVIGVDGVNRMLHGSSNPQGWRVGVNVLYLNDPNQPVGEAVATSPLTLKKIVRDLQGNEKEVFRLDVLENSRVDGIVKSNDEPFSFTSNGSRDAVVFNNVIQGPTLVNNGYLLYEPEANPGYNVNGAGSGQKHGALPLRTVEAHPRGSVEGGYHLGGGGHGRPGVVGSQTWLGHGQYDYVAAFTGTYSTYPGQMFDRHVQPMNSLYLGLRAYELSTEAKLKLKRADDSLIFADDPAGRADAAAAQCYFYQYMPFASRKAWLCQYVHDEVLRGLAQTPAVSQQATVDRINNSLVNHNKGAKKSRFDEDIFDAVRTEDLANMVGAWHLGRVLDIKSQRLTAYDGGPSDTGFSLMVDVQIGWQDARPVPGGADDLAEQAADALICATAYSSREFDPITHVQAPRPPAQNDPLNRRAIDQHNAQFPSLKKTLGGIVAESLETGFALYAQLRRVNDGNSLFGKVNPNFNLARTIGVRWPVLDKAWKAITDVLDPTRPDWDDATYGAWINDVNLFFQGIPENDADIEAYDPANPIAYVQIGDDPNDPTGTNLTTTGFSVETLYRLLVVANDPVNAEPVVKVLLSTFRSIGLGQPALYDNAGTMNNAMADRLRGTLRQLFAPVLGPPKKADGTPLPQARRSFVSREGFFYAFAGVRVKPSMRADWFQYGPAMYPTLTQMDDDPRISDGNLPLEQLEADAELTKASQWHDDGHLCTGVTGVVLEPAKRQTLRAILAKVKSRLNRNPDGRDSSGSSSGVDVATAESSLASSWQSIDDAQLASTEAPVATPAPAPAPTPTPQQAAVTAAVERSAPITAAAMAAAAPKKRGSSKSPARARPAAGAATGATASAAAERTQPPAGAAAATNTPLLPSLAPAPTSTSTSAARVDTGAGVAAPGSIANPPAAAVAARRRDRNAAGANTSTVSAIFDGLFGSGLEQATAGGPSDTGAVLPGGGSPPASPTPSSGSEQGSGTGPKTFRRGGAAGGSSRPR